MLEESLGLFILGIVTFLSPCSIALILVYLTYTGGVSENLRKGLVIGCCFAAAMCLVFFTLGYAVSSLIPIDIINSRLFFAIAGILLVLLGANNTGVLNRLNLNTKVFGSLTEELNALKLTALTRFSKYNYAFGSFLFGAVVSIALAPCALSLVLPAILLTIFSAPTPFHGGLLLFTFGLGHALPVIVISGLLGTAHEIARERISSIGESTTKMFGLLFVIIGIGMIIYALGGW